ncbi:hypothetical protein Q9966_009345, partial [Columba livia]
LGHRRQHLGEAATGPMDPKLLDLTLGVKIPVTPGSKPVFSRGKLGEKLHRPSGSFDLGDPLGRRMSNEYNSLHDPHLQAYHQRKDNVQWLKRQGLVTSDGNVVCSLKEFNQYRQYRTTLKLEAEKASIREQSVAELTGSQRSLRVEIADLRAAAANTSSINEALAVEKVQLNNLVLQLEQENEVVSEKVAELERARVCEQEQLSWCERTKAELCAEKAQLEQLLQEAEEQQEGLRVQLRRLAEEKEETQEQLSEVSRQQESASTGLEQLRQESSRQGLALAKVCEEKEVLVQEKAALELRLAAVERDRQGLSEQLAEARPVKETLERSLFEAQQRVSQLEIARSQLEMRLHIGTQAKEVIQGEVKCLQRELEAERSLLRQERENAAQQLLRREQQHDDTLRLRQSDHEAEIQRLLQDLARAREGHQSELQELLERWQQEKAETEREHEKQLLHMEQKVAAVQAQQQEEQTRRENAERELGHRRQHLGEAATGPMDPKLLDLTLGVKISVTPGSKPVFSRGKLGEKLHRPSGSFDLGDPLGRRMSNEYNSLHDPHLQAYHQRKDNVQWLKRQGLVTSDGNVVCSLKEFNQYRQYRTTLKLEAEKASIREQLGHRRQHLGEAATGPMDPKLLDLTLGVKIPVTPGSKPVFSRGKLGEKLHRPSGSFDLGDPLGRRMSNEYNSLHDPHLQAYHQRKDNVQWLKRQGLVTSDGNVVCSLKEFNQYRQYRTMLKLEAEKASIREQRFVRAEGRAHEAFWSCARELLPSNLWRPGEEGASGQSVAELTGSQESLSVEIADLRAAAANTSSINEALAVEKVQLNNLVLQLEQENEVVSEKVAELERARVCEQEQLSWCERTKAELCAEKAQLEQLLQEAEEQQEGLRVQLRRLAEEKEETQEQLSEVSRQQESASTGLEQLCQESSRQGLALAKVCEEKEVLVQEKAALELRLAAVERDRQGLSEQLAEARPVKETLERSLFEAQQRVSQLEIARSQLEMRLHIGTQAKEVIQGEVKCLQRELEAERSLLRQERENAAQQLLRREQQHDDTLRLRQSDHEAEIQRLLQDLLGHRRQHLGEAATGPMDPKLLDLTLGVKIPVTPSSKPVFSRGKLGEKLHRPSGSFDLGDPLGRRMSNEYNSLHDPHLQAYHQRKDNVQWLKRQGLVTSDGNVVCSLKEFNQYRQYRTTLKLEAEKASIREQLGHRRQHLGEAATGPMDPKLLDLTLGVKIPVTPGSKPVFSRGKLGEKLHRPSGSFDLGDPLGRRMSNEYNSLHDPHLQAYHQRKDNVQWLKRQGLVTSDGNVVCSLKEFNQYRQYRTMLKLEAKKASIREQEKPPRHLPKLEHAPKLTGEMDTSRLGQRLLLPQKPSCPPPPKGENNSMKWGRRLSVHAALGKGQSPPQPELGHKGAAGALTAAEPPENSLLRRRQQIEQVAEELIAPVLESWEKRFPSGQAETAASDKAPSRALLDRLAREVIDCICCTLEAFVTCQCEQGDLCQYSGILELLREELYKNSRSHRRSPAEGQAWMKAKDSPGQLKSKAWSPGNEQDRPPKEMERRAVPLRMRSPARARSSPDCSQPVGGEPQQPRQQRGR